MASGTSSTATLFTLPSYTSRSYQIIEPQLNRGSIRSPDQRSFVWIYFKKMRGYHVSNVKGVTPALARSARVARAVYVCPIAKHPAEGPRQRVRKQSPGTTQPAISRILPPRTKRHQPFKTLPWNSSNQKGLVQQLFLKALKLIFLRARQPLRVPPRSSAFSASHSPFPIHFSPFIIHYSLFSTLYSLSPTIHSPSSIITWNLEPGTRNLHPPFPFPFSHHLTLLPKV
jgi:hypothetical protein